MPNYEPTPRRFSTISVSRSASRRNSIDDAARPSIVRVPPDLQDSPPVDLANVLRHLQHVEQEGEQERGRTRQSGGDNATRATRGDDGLVTAPSARRENSASTRERIVLWEERCRSRSKGRSKSRGRDTGSKHRISVVPEVPELVTAFTTFQPQDMSGLGEQGAENYKALGPGVADAFWQQDTSPDNTELARVQNVEDGRPQTPVRQTGERPLTPETMPRLPLSIRPDAINMGSSNRDQKLAAKAGTSDRKPKVVADTGILSTPRPRSDYNGTPGIAMPLTPQTTPEQKKTKIQGIQRHTPDYVGEQPTPSSVGGYTAVLEPPIHPGHPIEEEETPPQSPPQYYSPSDLLSEPSPQQRREQVHVSTLRSPPRLSGVAPSQSPPGSERETRYHNVWRINPYQPDFPLPDRPPDYVDIQTLGQAGFTGTPLQKMPQGQLPAGPRNHPETDLAPNPYARTTGPGSGDWIVNIPPSPSAAYVPGEHKTRRPRPRSRSRTVTERYASRSDMRRHEWDAPPVIERALHAASVSMIQGLNVPTEVYRGLRDIYYPAPGRPNIIKAYPIRRRLPLRIFFPSHHDLTSPALLPTLFTIHGGAFTVGSPADDDALNRTFADSYTILVIALNYAKAPWAAFPAPLLDVEALYHAALNDDSLPIDRMRVALAGSDAGANLALALAQLPSVRSGIDPNPQPHPFPNSSTTARSNPPPTAVISITGILDFTTPPASKLPTRPYKRQLRGPRGWGPALDWMARLLPSSAWSYIPYGHDAADPLLSPLYAARADLPPHVFVIAAELDCLAMESWVAVCRWAGRRAVPGRGERVGREGVAVWRGCLDDGRGEDGERFGWCEETGAGDHGSTRWLLVPDVVHGFDSAGWRSKYLWGDEVARMDAEMKTIAYQREVAEWLWGVVWKGDGS
ncbi:Arylacetamide deacetylase [Parachaetomium inaequale]|uniref:Arylacetamide deacetylase n=1 Tax=Parachaetomium inaequale TaxID=2588326 RepID=A0AAN6P678_9PEZI|nr:Arylacetamide deacetylase [Parachaetomium inaequale]